MLSVYNECAQPSRGVRPGPETVSKGGEGMDIGMAHQQLYDKIPSFKCKPGCTDCCGPVPFSKWEWDRVSDKRHATPEHIKTLTCPYAVNGRCEIYEQRPLICRLFGAVDAPLMTCPHGCGPVGKLTDEQAREMMRIYTQELIDK